MREEIRDIACIALMIAVTIVLNSGEAKAVSQEFDVSVVPANMVVAIGRQELQPVDRDRPEAFAFPSLLPNETINDSVSYPIKSFFCADSGFPAKCVFTWSCWLHPPLQIIVERPTTDPTTAVFSLDDKSLTQLLRRDWAEIRQIQCSFRNWLLACSRRPYFDDLDNKLRELWIEHFLEPARFECFAERHLNDESFSISSSTAAKDCLLEEGAIEDAWHLGQLLACPDDKFSNQVFRQFSQSFQTRVKDYCKKEAKEPPDEEVAKFEAELRQQLNNVINASPPLIEESKLSDDARRRLPVDAKSRTIAVNRAALNAAYPQLAGSLSMWATRIHPREVLDIAWGSTAVYPFFHQDGIPDSYSRMTTSGSTRLHISADTVGVGLFPRRTKLMSADRQTSKETATELPFPPNWVKLFGTAFVPIFNSHDLLHERLLARRSNDDYIRKPPPYLYLLSPKKYVKADGDLSTRNVKQYATDAARRGIEIPSAAVDQLARRYILVGCDEPSKNAVEREFDRLIQAALATGNGQSEGKQVASERNQYVAGVFANQTALSIGRHVTFRNRSQIELRARLDSIGQVVGESNLPVLGKTSSRPLLDVNRTLCSSTGLPECTLRIHFHTTHPYVLDAAQVGEGDELVIHP